MPGTVEDLARSADVNKLFKMVEKPDDVPPSECPKEQDHDLMAHRMDLLESFMLQTFSANFENHYTTHGTQWKCCKKKISPSQWPLLAKITNFVGVGKETAATTNTSSVVARLPVITHTRTTRCNSVDTDSCSSSEVISTQPDVELLQSSTDEGHGFSTEIHVSETTATPTVVSEKSSVPAAIETKEKYNQLAANQECDKATNLEESTSTATNTISSNNHHPIVNGNSSSNNGPVVVVTFTNGQTSENNVPENGIVPKSTPSKNQQKDSTSHGSCSDPDGTSPCSIPPQSRQPPLPPVTVVDPEQNNGKDHGKSVVQWEGGENSTQKETRTSLAKKDELVQKRDILPPRKSGHIQITRQMTRNLHGIPSSTPGTSLSLRAVNSVASDAVEPPSLPKKRTVNNRNSLSLFGRGIGAQSPEYRYDPKTKKPIPDAVPSTSSEQPAVTSPTKMRTRQSMLLWEKKNKKKESESEESESESPVTPSVVPSDKENETRQEEDLNSSFNSAIIPECVMSDSDSSPIEYLSQTSSQQQDKAIETIDLDSETDDLENAVRPVTEQPVVVSTAEVPDGTCNNVEKKIEQGEEVVPIYLTRSDATSSTDCSSLSSEGVESNAGSGAERDESLMAVSPVPSSFSDGGVENENERREPTDPPPKVPDSGQKSTENEGNSLTENKAGTTKKKAEKPDDADLGEVPPVLLPILPLTSLPSPSTLDTSSNDDTFVQCPSLTKYDDPKPCKIRIKLNQKRDVYGMDRSDETPSQSEEDLQEVILLTHSATAAVAAVNSLMLSSGNNQQEQENDVESSQKCSSSGAAKDKCTIPSVRTSPRKTDDERPLMDRLVARRQAQNRPFPCSKCLGSFWTEELRQQHVLTQHNVIDLVEDDGEENNDKFDSAGQNEQGTSKEKDSLKKRSFKDRGKIVRRPPSKRKKLTPAKLRDVAYALRRRASQTEKDDSDSEEESDHDPSSAVPGTSSAAIGSSSRSTATSHKHRSRKRTKVLRYVVCPYCDDIVSRGHRWYHLDRCASVTKEQYNDERAKKGIVGWREFTGNLMSATRQRRKRGRSQSKPRAQTDDEWRAYSITDTEVSRSRRVPRGGGTKTDHWNSSDEEPLAERNKRYFTSRLGLTDSNPPAETSRPRKMVLKGPEGDSVSRTVIYPETSRYSTAAESDGDYVRQPSSKRFRTESQSRSVGPTTCTTDIWSSDEDDEIIEVFNGGPSVRVETRQSNDSVDTDIVSERDFQDPDATYIIPSAVGSQDNTSTTTVGSTPRKRYSNSGKVTCEKCSRMVSFRHLLQHQKSSRCVPISDMVWCAYCGKPLRPASMKSHIRFHCHEAANAVARGETLLDYNSQTEDEATFSQTEDDAGSQTEGEGESAQSRNRFYGSVKEPCPHCGKMLHKSSVRQHLRHNRCKGKPKESVTENQNGESRRTSQSRDRGSSTPQSEGRLSSSAARKSRTPQSEERFSSSCDGSAGNLQTEATPSIIPERGTRPHQTEEAPSTSRGKSSIPRRTEVPSTSRGRGRPSRQTEQIPSTSSGRNAVPASQVQARSASRYGRNRRHVITYCENLPEFEEDNFFVRDQGGEMDLTIHENLGLAVAAAVTGYHSPEDNINNGGEDEPFDSVDHICHFEDCRYEPNSREDWYLHREQDHDGSDEGFPCTAANCTQIFYEEANMIYHRSGHRENFPLDATGESIINNPRLQPKLKVRRLSSTEVEQNLRKDKKDDGKTT